jgi:hypothetical protein
MEKGVQSRKYEVGQGGPEESIQHPG